MRTVGGLLVRAPSRHCQSHRLVCTQQQKSHSAFTRCRATRIVIRCAANVGKSPKQGGGVRGVFRGLGRFWFGKNSVWQGGVGLFILTGIGLGLGLVTWARGQQISTGRGYRATIAFPEACGILLGTPIRMRGVQVGSVVGVKPYLDHVDVQIEVLDANTVIPCSSKVLANQSGLILEPFVDIMPPDPIPQYHASPVEKDECNAEGVLLCEDGRIKGEKGVVLDDLVYLCTKLAQQMESEGLVTVFDAAADAAAAVEQSRPLLEKTARLLQTLAPLLSNLRTSRVMENVEALTKMAGDAAADVRALQLSVIDETNAAALRRSIAALTRSLEHIERVTADLGATTTDGSFRDNLRSIIDALTRIVDD